MPRLAQQLTIDGRAEDLAPVHTAQRLFEPPRTMKGQTAMDIGRPCIVCGTLTTNRPQSGQCADGRATYAPRCADGAWCAWRRDQARKRPHGIPMPAEPEELSGA